MTLNGDDRRVTVGVDSDLDAKLDALDLADLMDHWAKSEAALFSRPCKVDGDLLERPAEAEASAPTQDAREASERWARRKVVVFLHRLLYQHDASEDLPAALTLFDALRLADGLMQVTAPATITAAVARLALKVGTAVAAEDLEMNDFYRVSSHLSEEPISVDSIDRMEANIVALLGGRVRPISPPQWSCIVVERLSTFGVPQAALKEASVRIRSWAALLLESMAATEGMPPKAFGLGACVMGLISSGAMDAEEVRPPQLGDEVWEATILAQLGASAVQTQNGAKISVDQVAKAACCTTDSLRHQVFDLAANLQRIITTAGPAATGPQTYIEAQ
jgi:hypothetical protein